ncbi:c-type cytochrome [Chromobacterium amazonense]|uniref:c-type cytochrome n=1 Tax=Chromobacterium amazonense TaxID=1382803 RepID=UPI0009F50D1F|nr:c-type cytochrome [Chromobacterium amazonense]
MKALTLVLALSAASTALAAPPKLAQQLCAACHGIDGNGPPPTPRLAGQQADYIAQQLDWMRLGQRDDGGAHKAVWDRLKNDADIQAISRYYAAQKPAPQPAKSADPALLASGRKLYTEGNLAVGAPPCFTCHGEQGEGGSAAPRLAGQHAAYLAQRMKVSDTPQPPARMEMQEILKTLSQDDVKALLAYMATL